MMSCDYELSDAAYVLGALSPAERHQYEQHLRTCDNCTAAVRELAGLPGLLARLPVDWVATVDGTGGGDPPVPETLLPGLLAKTRREHRHGRWRVGIAAGLVAASVAAVGTAVIATRPDQPTQQQTATRIIRLEPAGKGHTFGTVWLTASPSGSSLRVRCDRPQSGSDGYGDDSGGSDRAYTLWLFGPRRKESTAAWVPMPDRDVDLSGSSSIAPSDVLWAEVHDAAGETVMAGH